MVRQCHTRPNNKAVPDDAKFKVLITNAVHFKGLWVHAFDKIQTRKQPFTIASNGNVQVEMMTKGFSEQDVKSLEAPGSFCGVKLPYKGSNIQAIALLPDPKKYGADAGAALANTILKGFYHQRSGCQAQRQSQI